MAEYPDRLTESLAALSGMLLSEEPLETTLQRVAVLACETVPGCDGCGVTLMSSTGPTTAAATDDIVAPVDSAQYDAGDGPCLTAYRQRRIVRVDSMIADDRWPETGRAAGEVGVESSISFPLVVREEAIGALNLYSMKPNAFSLEAERTGLMFAEQAAVALANAQTHGASVQLATNLEHALESRSVIDQAIGVMIAHHGGSRDDGFARLRELSQSQNVKLRDVALRVLHEASRDDQSPLGDEPQPR
jgi:GAF domain-containing protein